MIERKEFRVHYPNPIVEDMDFTGDFEAVRSCETFDLEEMYQIQALRPGQRIKFSWGHGNNAEVERLT
jgi:hypothetical protein